MITSGANDAAWDEGLVAAKRATKRLDHWADCTNNTLGELPYWKMAEEFAEDVPEFKAALADVRAVPTGQAAPLDAWCLLESLGCLARVCDRVLVVLVVLVERKAGWAPLMDEVDLPFDRETDLQEIRRIRAALMALSRALAVVRQAQQLPCRYPSWTAWADQAS